ncbi:MAG: response regulator [Rhodomicrobium sp.]
MTADVCADDRLQGLRVLIVEDETLVAMLLEEYLSELGCEVAASVRRVGKGLESLEHRKIDAAVLDVNVAGESVYPVAEALERRGIPFVFASGYGAKGVEGNWGDRPMLQKPFGPQDLKAALLASLAGPA